MTQNLEKMFKITLKMLILFEKKKEELKCKKWQKLIFYLNKNNNTNIPTKNFISYLK